MVFAPRFLTANLTATGLAEGGSSVPTRTADPAIPLDLDAGGHYSMELKILWSESSVRVRPPPPAHLQTVGVDGRGRMLRWHRLFAKSKRKFRR